VEARRVAYSFADYGEIVLEHYENPRNVGEFEQPDAVALVGNPACGDQMKMSLRILNGVIEEARFKAFGCGAAIAASSMTTTLIRGMKLEDVGKITNRTVAEALGGLPPSKLHCSVLAEEAIREALADYRRRSSGRAATPDCSRAPEGQGSTDQTGAERK